MAREYAKTNLTIWQDPDWRALPWPAQHVYKMFWEHPSLSYCGVADWRPSKMLGWGAGWDRTHLTALTDCLRARHFLVVDEDTEECLVRSWIRFDGVVRQPRLAVSLAKAFSEIGSNAIRGVIVNELAKLREREPEAQGWAKSVVTDLLRLPQIEAKSLPVPEDPFASGFAITLGSVSPSVSEAFGRNASSGLGSVSDPPTTATATSPKQQQHPEADEPPSPEAADATPTREDVDRICRHLAHNITQNGAKEPTINKGWLDAARLMLDKDGRPEPQVHQVIDWATNDDFWRANILSVPKLREKYDQLLLKAKSERSNVHPLQRAANDGPPPLPYSPDDRR